MVDENRKKMSKGTPESTVGHRYRQHNTVQKAKKAVGATPGND